MDISKVLDDAKKAMQIESDYELAKRLEISKANLSHFRKSERIPDAYTCARLAEAIGIDPIALIAAVEAATEKNEARRNYWQALSKKVGVGMTIGFLALIAAAPGDSETGVLKTSTVGNFQNI